MTASKTDNFYNLIPLALPSFAFSILVCPDLKFIHWSILKYRTHPDRNHCLGQGRTSLMCSNHVRRHIVATTREDHGSLR